MEKTDIKQLREMAENACGEINKIYLHWTAGRHDQLFDDYHINIDGDGNIYVDGEFTDLKSHTWHRNTGAIGIAIDACYDASTDDLGDYAPTCKQIEVLSIVVANLCESLGIEINNNNVITHAEAATIDGYGPGSGDPETRWDLAILSNGDEWMSGGNTIRGKAIWYQQEDN